MINRKTGKKKITNKAEIRGIFQTNPSLASVPRKKPDLLEIPISGGKSAFERFTS